MKKFYNQFLFSILLLLIIPFEGFCSHIVGGSLTYTYNGGSNYTVMLKLYRDCSGSPFPGSAAITVLQADGSLFSPSLNFTLPGGTITNITPVLPPCATSPSVVPCAEERIYTATVSIPASPGGVHMYYGVCCRNGSVLNITTPGSIGETFYAYIPCYKSVWAEDFTLADGTTSDVGTTAWTTSLGATAPASAQVASGQFEVDGANNGFVLWTSQVIPISSYTSGVNLSVNASRAGTMEAGDSLKIYYSLNGGALTLFPTNGQLLGNFATPSFAKATGLVGNTIQIIIRTKYNATSPASEIYRLDMVTVYDNTFIANSNPAFTQLPPLLFCASNTFSLNQSATDIDGDVLVYSMYTPYTDAPVPTFPNNIASIPTVTWVAGYSANSPFNSGGPNVTINASTGIMTGVANSLGQYVFGVKCSEYRGGVLLSETTRDYEVNAVTCPPFVPSAPIAGASSNTLCAGQTLNLTASFTAGATYNWTGPNSFTSNVQNPTIVSTTTAAAGVYSVSATVGGCTGPPGTTTVVINPIPSAPVAAGNTPLCAGQTLSLTATFTSGATYSWSGPNSFTAATQNPTISSITLAGGGTYTVNNTVLGCTSSDATVTIVVNPIPSAPTAGANTPLCVGQTLSLTASFTSGATYSWSGPNTFTSVLQDPTISNITLAGSGVYSVNASVGGCAGPLGTVSVLVNPTPLTPTLTVNSPLCAGQTLSLTATSSVGATYSWVGPNSFVSSIQNPTIGAITLSESGVYSVSADVAGCSSPTGTISVVVNAAPATPIANFNSPICTGQTLSLTSTFVAGASYNWTGPNSFTSSVQNPTIGIVTPAATGDYSVTATLAGCPSPIGTVSVTVSNPPSAPIVSANTPLCVGQTLNLAATFTTGLTYNWSGPNTFTSNLQNPSIAGATLVDAGTYTVFATTAGGCAGPNSTLAVVVNPSPSAPTLGSNSPLCEGQSLNLTATFTSGVTYSWAGPNSFTSSSQNPTITNVTLADDGTYSVIATAAGCPGPVATISVTVNPIPASPIIGSNSPLCVGQTLNLSSTFSTGASYNWTGPNSFTSTNQSPSIVSVSLTNSGTYSVTQTILGCVSSDATISVVINPIPASPTLTSNSPICELQTLSLTASSGASAYNWVGPNAFVSSIQNPTIASASVSEAGTYSVTQTILGCTSPAAIITITINTAAPTPTIISNSPVCLNQTINFTQTPIGSATYNWTGPNSFTSTTQNPTITGASTLATGIYSVFATVAGCPGLTSTLAVLVSNPGTVSAGFSPTVCANNALVNLNGLSSTGSGTWSSSGSGVFGLNTLNGNYTPSGSEIIAGTSTLTLTSTNNGGCIPVTATTSILITPAPTASAGSSQTVCANNATITLNGSVTIASGGIWSSSGTGSFVPNNTALTASYVPSVLDITSGTFTLTLSTTGNGNCLVVSDAITISTSPAPIVIPGANPQVVCKNNPNFQLNASSTTGSGVWASSGTGTFSPNNTVLNPTYIPSTTDTLSGGVTLTLTSTNNGGCNLVSQTMAIVYVSTLSVNAGGNQTVCANNSNVALIGVSTTSAGIWTSSGTGTFSPSSGSLITNYVPSAADILAGNVTLTLTTANNGGCNPISNTMTVLITPKPTANAGLSQTVCANNATVALTGSVTIAGGGSWSSSGTGTFTPTNTLMNVNYIPSSADTTAGSILITLGTTSNGNCNAVTNTMVINFTPAPLVDPGVNISVCKTNAMAILNGYSSTGSGTWTSTGTGTFSPSNAVLNPSYTPSTADTIAGSVILTLTSVNNGACNAITKTVSITYSGIPSVTAGPSQTVCANNANVVLTGTTSTGSGTWTSSGGGVFTSNTPNGNYTPSPSDIVGGALTFTLTSTNNGGCLPVAKTTTVYFTPAPQVDAGISQTVCSNSSSVSLSGSFSISTGAVWSSSGNGTFTPNTTIMNTNYFPSIADTASGSVKLFLTTTGNGNCLQVIDSVLINFTKAPFINAGADIALCPYSPNPVITGTSSVNNFTWVTSGSGSFSPNASVLNPVYIPSSGDNTAGIIKLTLVSGSTTCGSASDTLLVEFKPKPTSNFSFVNQCLGSVASFTDLSSSSTSSVTLWYWHFDADTSTLKNPTYTFTTSGTHTVTLLVGNNSCVDSVSKQLFINPKPSVNYSFTVLCHDSVKFVQNASVATGSIANWNWDFGDAGTSVTQNPYHVYADTGFYFVALQVKSDSNCVASYIDTVHVFKCNATIDVITPLGEAAVPSGFTPNGDGSNDVLFVKGGPFTSLDFRIFNEWGNQLFHSDVQSTGWDGTYKNSLQPGGRFIWTLNAERIDGKIIKMAGEVILNR